MPIGTVNGTTIHYESSGAGPPVVLIPGLGLTEAMWEPQVEALGDRNQVITVDPRGVGGSGRLDGWTHVLRRQADDVAALLRGLGVDTAVLCGVSYGGVLAQRIALDHPDLVAGLVVADSFADTRPRSAAGLAQWLTLYATGWAWLLPTGLLMPAIRRQYSRWPEALRRMEPDFRAMRRLEVVKIRYALNGVSYVSELSDVRCPSMGIVGDTSPLLRDYMRQVADAIPGCRLDVVDDSFDPSNLCRPAQFNRLLAEFLDGIGWN